MSSAGASSGYYERRHSSSSRPSFRGCCCCLVLLFFLIALLVVAFILSVVIFVKPKKPQIDLAQVQIQIGAPSSSSSTASISSADVDAAASAGISIIMSFKVTNDNKVGITFAESRFVVLYKAIPLGQGFIQEIYIPAHTTRLVCTTIFASPASLQQTDVQSLLQDAAAKDRVELNVRGDPGAKLVVLGLSSPEVQVAVDCSVVISPSERKMISHQCSFDGVGL